jgi:hypothetical protein
MKTGHIYREHFLYREHREHFLYREHTGLLTPHIAATLVHLSHTLVHGSPHVLHPSHSVHPHHPCVCVCVCVGGCVVCMHMSSIGGRQEGYQACLCHSHH